MKNNIFQKAYITALAAYKVAIEQEHKALDADDEYQAYREQLKNRKKNNLSNEAYEELIKKMSDKEVDVESKFNKDKFRSLLLVAEKELVYAFRDFVLKAEPEKVDKNTQLKKMFNDLDKIMLNLTFRQKLVDIAMKFKWEYNGAI